MCSPKDLDRDAERSNDDSHIGQYALDGKPVRCPHCNGTSFKTDEAQLNTALATLLKLDWTNKSATILICNSCSQIQWFGTRPSRVP